jgi:electron transfer flavoprotein alpha/beta subunit
MNIFVIMKRTFGTEEKMFFNDGPIDDSSAEHIINPYDENNRFR